MSLINLLKQMSEPIHILSLGAGVQSSTVALKAALGELTPMPKLAVFADTQAEPKAVYEWLDYLEKLLPFKVKRVTRGNLAEKAIEVRTSKTSGNKYTKHNIPAFIIDSDGKIGLMNRHCTGDFKIDVIIAFLRVIVGKLAMKEWRKKHSAALKELSAWKAACKLARKQKLPQPVRPFGAWKECQDDALIIQWIGISADEAGRAKDGRHPWIKNIWPLLEAGTTRKQCLEWIKNNQFLTPPRSACIFCPYHDDAEWRRMKADDPDSFIFAVDWEKRMQAAMKQSSELRGTPYLHHSCKPLSEVDFSNPSHQEGELFQNECEGMCGV